MKPVPKWKNLQELEIDSTRDITDAGGEEPCDKPALRVIETTRLGICMKGQPIVESVQCSDCNCCSQEVRTELADRLRVGTSQECPAAESNSASQFDGCCGDNEADCNKSGVCAAIRLSSSR